MSGCDWELSTTNGALYPFSVYLHCDLHGSACNLHRDDHFIQSLESGGSRVCELHQDVGREVLAVCGRDQQRPLELSQTSNLPALDRLLSMLSSQMTLMSS